MMLFATGNDKSPGPDGYTSFFFKKAWDIVKGDVIKAVLFFFDRIKLPLDLTQLLLLLCQRVVILIPWQMSGQSCVVMWFINAFLGSWLIRCSPFLLL